MYVCAHMCVVCTCVGKRKVVSNVFLNYFSILTFESGAFSEPGLGQANWAVSFRGPPFLSPSTGIIGLCYHTWILTCVLGNLNSGPCDCMAGALPTEPPPNPSENFLFPPYLSPTTSSLMSAYPVRQAASWRTRLSQVHCQCLYLLFKLSVLLKLGSLKYGPG